MARNKKHYLFYFGASILILGLIAGIAGILVIKYNTPLAANFADNNLRPLIGDENVIQLEKIFYNISDVVERKISQSNVTVDMSYSGGYGDFANLKTRLNLSPITINNGFTPEPKEGKWEDIPLALFPNYGVIATTYIRPDPQRSFAYVNLAQIDTNLLRLGIVAGKKEPAGKVGRPGPGVVPSDIIDNNKLVAAFDGGFQYRDGEYGMIVDGFTYLPLKNDLGTVVGYKNGVVKIIRYNGQDFGNNVAFVRQNCPILVENGQLTVDDPLNKKLWGRTLTTSILTWRTGLGVTPEGNLIFAVGNNLTPETLGTALIAAGATNAVQLDINPFWVRFNIFDSLGNGQYKSYPLTKRLTDGSKSYLTGYSKDFFYLYKNN